MNRLKKVTDFLNDEEGLTVVEYVVGAAVLVGMVSLLFTNMGKTLSDKLADSLS